MPQLDLLTYQVQFFWLLCGFCLIYFFSLFFFLPRFYSILKTRKAWTLSTQTIKIKAILVANDLGFLTLSKKNFNFLTYLSGVQFQFLKFLAGFFSVLNFFSRKNNLFLIFFLSKRELSRFF